MVAQRIPAPILAPSARSSSDAANTGDAALIARMARRLAQAERVASQQQKRISYLQAQVDSLARRMNTAETTLIKTMFLR